MPSEVTFISMKEEHRALLLHWLSQPHAQQWWGDAAEEVELIYDDKGEHEPFIACVDDEPIAYIQAWWPSKHPDLPWQFHMTRDTRGIDTTIGEEKNLSRGLGSMIIKAFATKLFTEGAKRLIIDPDITNHRAKAAYIKAGFVPYDTYVGDGETSVLMEMFPPSVVIPAQAGS
jgi:aminoglycoside 6'-N-acetyltransferase